MSHATAADRVAIGPQAAPERGRQRRWLPAVMVVWLLFAAVLVFSNLAAIASFDFRDPDDQLRLVQVRDLLAGQSWFDLHQYRVDAAHGGVAMHWSRIVDVPIAASIVLLQPLLGQMRAEQATLILIPMLTLLAIMASIGWMASRTLASRERIFALLAVVFAAPVIVQVMPLRIDHHGWQIALAVVSVAAFLDLNQRRGGLLSGAALATWMAISLEGLPFSAALVGVLALWAIVDQAMTRRLVATMQGLATATAALFLGTRGLADLAEHCDAISPVHVAIFAWGALAIGVPATLRPKSRLALFGGLLLAGAGAIALLAAGAPQCARGSFDMIDPVVRSYWYDNVLEGKPLWKGGAVVFAQYLIPALIGLWSAVTLVRRSEGQLRRWWIFYAIMLGCATAISLAVVRSAAISGALATLPLGFRLASWLDGLKRPANPFLRAGELLGTAALVFCALIPAVPILAVQKMLGNGIAANAEKAGQLACATRYAASTLDALPPGDILAPLDFGPDVIFNSNRRVLATGHHRGARALRDLIDAFTGSPQRARAIMDRNALRYLMICPGAPEIQIYRNREPNGFGAQLLAGKVPAWLTPVPLPRASGFRMWSVADATLTPARTAAPRR